jgi:hypothetical protein
MERLMEELFNTFTHYKVAFYFGDKQELQTSLNYVTPHREYFEKIKQT